MKTVAVVGAGLFGCTIARLLAENSNYKVKVFEKRSHIAGNCYDYRQNGILIHKFGSHIFHTNNLKVWQFINRFSKFINYKHKASAVTSYGKFDFPLNFDTFQKYYPQLKTNEDLLSLLSSFRKYSKPSNFEEAALNSVGDLLYKEFYFGYTLKQWGVHPKELPASLFRRIPVHLGTSNFYFTDHFQGLPRNGYTDLMSKMLDHPNIEVNLNCDFLYIKSQFLNQTPVIYSGNLDHFFENKFGPLSWRTLNFEIEELNVDEFQGQPVVNYCEKDVPYTRVHEFKFFPNSESPKDKTIIMREYPKKFEVGDLPFYPIENDETRLLFKSYKSQAQNLNKFYFGGRLGSYKYFDMDMTIANAFKLEQELIK